MLEVLDRFDVSRSEVGNMNIVAFARTVRRGIIRSQNLKRRTHPQSGIDGQRNQMGLRVMSLRQISAAVSTCGIEIAEYTEAQLMGMRHILDDLLTEVFRPAIRADWMLRYRFGNRQAIGQPVGRAGAREYDLLYPVSQHR